MSTMSLRGLYNFRPDILDDFAVPDGVSKKILFPLLVADTSDLEILYPDPDVMKYMVSAWSRSLEYKWEHLYKTTTAEYNPIENYDRTEEWTTNNKGTEFSTVNQSGDGKTSPRGTDTVTHEVAGYDSGTLVQSERTRTDAGIETNSQTHSNMTGNNSTENTETRTGRAHGNIGVTTSQQMLQSERDIADFSIYNAIIRDFINRFCLEVY